MGVLEPLLNASAGVCSKSFNAAKKYLLGFLPEAVRGAHYVLVDYFTN